MPIYEYQCPACGHRFEELVRSQRDEKQVKCPACGAAKVSREFSVFAAHEGPGRASNGPGPCDTCCNPAGGCPFGS